MDSQVYLWDNEKFRRQAHAKNLPGVVWIYPRGKGTKGKSKTKLMAYAARTGLEIGADAYVEKPFNMDEMLKIIKEVLE